MLFCYFIIVIISIYKNLVANITFLNTEKVADLLGNACPILSCKQRSIFVNISTW